MTEIFVIYVGKLKFRPCWFSLPGRRVDTTVLLHTPFEVYNFIIKIIFLNEVFFPDAYQSLLSSNFSD